MTRGDRKNRPPGRLAWAEIHKDELLANWALAMNSELPYNIEPLK